MSGGATTALIGETLDRLLAGRLPSTDVDAALWRRLDDAGFTRVGVPATAGGSGGTVEDAHVVLDRIGAAAAAVPLAETLVAGWLCARAGVVLPPGVATFAPAVPGDRVDVEARAGGWHVGGTVHRVPWAAVADHVVATAPHGRDLAVAVVPRRDLRVRPSGNLAGEGRDTVELAGVVLSADRVGVAAGLPVDQALAWAATVRSVVTAGALVRILDLTRDHVNTREQFGRPLASFQVVRHQLAEMAAEVAAASAAAEAALVLTGGSPGLVEVAAAKVRTARAATAVATGAHQLHGAIGFTDEHPLHRWTTRVWSWRDELGTQGWWEERLGAELAATGADLLWPAVADGGTAAEGGDRAGPTG